MSEEQSTLEFEKIASEEIDSNSDTASYKINTYGADFTLEILSKKLNDGEIVVPQFQRRYVWNNKKASKLIESFLLGLPVPQIFVYRDEDSQDLLVVDGQQRLKSINYFFQGVYADNTPFRLQGVKSQWEGKLYTELSQQDQRKLNNSILRATIFEQTDPQDKTSVFQIFERLNTGGMALNQQEIRNCVIHGEINNFLESLNQYPKWRELLRKDLPDPRMRDIEMILRFFALYEHWETYTKPMKDFMSNYMKQRKDITSSQRQDFKLLFESIIDKLHSEIGTGAFRLKSAINVAMFDSIMVSLASVGIDNVKDLKSSFSKLKGNEAYLKYISDSTTDSENVTGRIKIAIRYFSE